MEKEEERKRNIDVKKKHLLVSSYRHTDQNRIDNMGMCPDQILNLDLLVYHPTFQPAEPLARAKSMHQMQEQQYCG